MTKPILGIDVSKKDLSLALTFNGSLKRLKISNDANGFKELTAWLKKENVTHLKACMEATGSYGERIADYLYEQGNEVHVVNPACIKAFAKSKLNRHKTDEVDSLLIAEYASKNDLRPYCPINPLLKELRSLYRCSQNLKHQYIQVANFLENKDRLPESVNSVYEHLKIYLEETIKSVSLTLEGLLVSQGALKQDYENLQTIPGIGSTTAIALLAEMPSLPDLENARQLAAYAGLTPSQRTSGTSLKGKSRLSKMGSSALRKALYFPAIVGKRYNPLLKNAADILKKKGKHTMVIIGALMRKLLHIVFGVLKHKTPFNPQICKINP
jgi:transposase